MCCACGGGKTGNQWQKSNGTLIERRKDAVGKVLPYLRLGIEKPCVLGGQGDSKNVSSSTECYDGSNWTISDELQEEKFGACAAIGNRPFLLDDSEFIVLIGGKPTFREVESFFGAEELQTSHSEQGDIWNNDSNSWKLKIYIL